MSWYEPSGRASVLGHIRCVLRMVGPSLVSANVKFRKELAEEFKIHSLLSQTVYGLTQNHCRQADVMVI